jgi:hypothetical protein
VLFDRPFRKKSFSSVSFSRFWFFPANAEKVHNLGFIDRYSWTVWKIAIICDDNCDVIRKTKNYVLNSEKKKEKKRKKKKKKEKKGEQKIIKIVKIVNNKNGSGRVNTSSQGKFQR